MKQILEVKPYKLNMQTLQADRETLQAHGANLTSSKPSRIGKGEDKDDITADGTEDGIGNQTIHQP